MSFGKRQNNTSHLSPRTVAINTRTPDSSPAFWFVLMFATLAILIPAAIYTQAPFSYNAPKQNLSFRQLSNIRMSYAFSPQNRQALTKAYGIDFSTILTKPSEEKTESMKAISRRCLPTPTPRSSVLPQYGLVYFQFATDYLLCAMRTQKERLAAPHERKRLADQLKRYTELRQHVISIIYAMETAIGTSAEERMITRHSYDAQNRSSHAFSSSNNIHWSQLGKELDPRIALRIQKLNKVGYLQAKDFGWHGLYLPADYAPYLKN